jgi:hypothetical protein
MLVSCTSSLPNGFKATDAPKANPIFEKMICSVAISMSSGFDSPAFPAGAGLAVTPVQLHFRQQTFELQPEIRSFVSPRT